ncbi:MAG: MAPEG family protein [Burkholderiaceae bacterium]
MFVQAPLLAPVFALVAWTFVVLLLVAFRRIRAALAGEVEPADFAMGESRRVPDAVALANRNYMNLLELPVLFYVACVAATALGAATAAMTATAWTYVALRVAHSLIHVTYNRLADRFVAFAASNATLAVLWFQFGLTLREAG